MHVCKEAQLFQPCQSFELSRYFYDGRNTSKTRLPVVNKNIVTQSQIIAGDPFSVNKRCDSKLMLDFYGRFVNQRIIFHFKANFTYSLACKYRNRLDLRSHHCTVHSVTNWKFTCSRPVLGLRFDSYAGLYLLVGVMTVVELYISSNKFNLFLCWVWRSTKLYSVQWVIATFIIEVFKSVCVDQEWNGVTLIYARNVYTMTFHCKCFMIWVSMYS